MITEVIEKWHSIRKPGKLELILPSRKTASRFILKESPKTPECLLNESLGTLHYHLSVTLNATKSIQQFITYRMALHANTMIYSTDYNTHLVFKELTSK